MTTYFMCINGIDLEVVCRFSGVYEPSLDEMCVYTADSKTELTPILCEKILGKIEAEVWERQVAA